MRNDQKSQSSDIRKKRGGSGGKKSFIEVAVKKPYRDTMESPRELLKKFIAN